MPTYLAGPAPNANITQDLHQVKLGVNYRLGDPGQWGDADSLKDGPVTLAPLGKSSLALATPVAGAGSKRISAPTVQTRPTFNPGSPTTI